MSKKKMKEAEVNYRRRRVIKRLAVDYTHYRINHRRRSEETPDGLVLSVDSFCRKQIKEYQDGDDSFPYRGWVGGYLTEYGWSWKRLVKDIKTVIQDNYRAYLRKDKIMYSLGAGVHETGFGMEPEADELKFRGDIKTVQNLFVPSILDAHRVAGLGVIKSYVVRSHIVELDDRGRENFGYRGEKEVYATADIKRYRRKQEREKEKEEKRKTAMAKGINKLPTEFQIHVYEADNGDEYEVFVKRSKATYHPRESSKVRWQLGLVIRCESHDDERWHGEGRGVYLASFITRSGAFQKKRFHQEMSHMLPDEIADLIMDNQDYYAWKEGLARIEMKLKTTK